MEVFHDCVISVPVSAKKMLFLVAYGHRFASNIAVEYIQRWTTACAQERRLLLATVFVCSYLSCRVFCTVLIWIRISHKSFESLSIYLSQSCAAKYSYKKSKTTATSPCCFSHVCIVGVLALPSALNDSGWIGLLLLFILAMASAYTAVLIGRYANRYRLERRLYYSGLSFCVQ